MSRVIAAGNHEEELSRGFEQYLARMAKVIPARKAARLLDFTADLVDERKDPTASNSSIKSLLEEVIEAINDRDILDNTRTEHLAMKWSDPGECWQIVWQSRRPEPEPEEDMVSLVSVGAVDYRLSLVNLETVHRVAAALDEGRSD